uniref:Uncharacterized protein n=1 Tax=Rhizophora mucronata TaxID=61149 RepID=A0A2P2QUZ0_RHIMU
MILLAVLVMAIASG